MRYSYDGLWRRMAATGISRGDLEKAGIPGETVDAMLGGEAVSLDILSLACSVVEAPLGEVVSMVPGETMEGAAQCSSDISTGQFFRETFKFSIYASDYMRRDSAAKGFDGMDLFVLLAETYIGEGYIDEDYCTQQKLSELWFTPKQTIHSAVVRLQKRGLVEMQPVPGSKKEKAIRFTPLGKEYVAQHITPMFQRYEEAIMQMNQGERMALYLLMQKYYSCIRSAFQPEEQSRNHPSYAK